jgi:hypothetical protein
MQSQNTQTRNMKRKSTKLQERAKKSKTMELLLKLEFSHLESEIKLIYLA